MKGRFPPRSGKKPGQKKLGPPPRGGEQQSGGNRQAERGRPEAREERPSPFTAQGFFVDGLAAVAEYIRFRPEAVTEIRCAKALRGEVESLLKKHGVMLAVGERQNVSEDQSPVTARVQLSAKDLAALTARTKGRTKDIIVALDHITDPRNLGAIVRTAAFFGVREILVPERRQVLLTQAAVNTAQGGFALADLFCVVNLARTLKQLQEDGYWIIGTAMQGEAFHGLVGAYEKVVLVLGAEDTGMSKGVTELCDRLAAIPSGAAAGDVTLDSLNVSVAAGIVLCAFANK